MISSKKIGLGSNYEFGVILGQISNLTQSMQIIYQNEALDISFSSWDKIFTFLEGIHKQGCIMKNDILGSVQIILIKWFDESEYDDDIRFWIRSRIFGLPEIFDLRSLKGTT